MTRGIPLARGVLKDAHQAALSDAAGQPVACVSRAVAFWPDGSIKWLLLDFQARLKAGTGGKFQLLVGDRAQPVAVPRPLEIAETPGRIVVDTGRLKLRLQNQGARLALTIGLDLDGDGKVTDQETILQTQESLFSCLFSHIQNPGNYSSHTWFDPGQPDPGQAEITELRVEERSPLRAVVLVRANLKHQFLASTIPPRNRPPTGTPVALRLHLYAGSSMVRLQHTFLFGGDVRHDFLRELGLRLPLPAVAGQKVRSSIGGRELELSGRPCGLLQENPDSALAWQVCDRKVETAGQGPKADGWLDVSGPKWGVTVGLRGMREMWPQEIEVDDKGVWTHFYSPRVVPMDVRRYAFKYGDGESTSTGFGSALGAMRTHEALWYFHPSEKSAPRQVQAMLEPPLARVRPRHVADTLAVGHVAEHGAPTNDRHYDDVLYHMPRLHQHNREFWRWFGFWDRGDEIQVYESGRQRWARDEGRYGWYNNEPLRDYNYHLAHLMTGNRRLWEQAEAMSFHVLEVDVRHARPQPLMTAAAQLEKQQYGHSTTEGIDLCGRRHNCQHWSDGYYGPRVGSPPGFRLCYYQTGDPVLREYLERLVATALATHRNPYMSADGDEAILWAMVAGYEMTHENRYLERMRSYARLQVDFARKHNGFPAARANWDWASNTAGAPPTEPGDDLWIWSFGGQLALVEIADVLEVPGLDEMLRGWLLAVEGLGPDGKRRETWADNIGACPLLAYYYRRTGDGRTLAWLQKRARGFHGSIPEDAPREDLPGAIMTEKFPAYTPNDGYGWVYSTTSFWYVGIPAWQGALRQHAREASSPGSP